VQICAPSVANMISTCLSNISLASRLRAVGVGFRRIGASGASVVGAV